CTLIFPRSLHDALPIYLCAVLQVMATMSAPPSSSRLSPSTIGLTDDLLPASMAAVRSGTLVAWYRSTRACSWSLRASVFREIVRSEEHTSELQSLRHLV